METTTNIERIIAKIDNDFNPDNSDWIPRVGAWIIDAMSMLKVLRTEVKKRRLVVKDRIAYSPCTIDKDNLKVFDKNGCEIEAKSTNTCCDRDASFTGEETETLQDISLTSSIASNPNAANAPDYTVFQQIDNAVYPERYNAYNYNFAGKRKVRNYVIVDCNKLELNFDTDYITIQSKEIVTKCSEQYGCDLPVIPNNGYLIEAIAAFCMYKMLSRGYKHPVYNLTANNPGINPYLGWSELKERARISVAIGEQGDIEDKGLWRSAMYLYDYFPLKEM
jgi:hypothetical protein